MENENRTYGYYLAGQDKSNQVDELRKYIKVARDIYSDAETEKARDELAILVDHVLEGDTIFFYTLEGILDSQALMNLLQKLKSKNIIVHVLDIPTTMEDFSRYGELKSQFQAIILDFLIDMAAVSIRQEFALERKWQTLGIENSKQLGIKLGRKPKPFPDCFLEDYRKWKRGLCTAKSLYQKYGWSNPVFYRKVKLFESQLVS